MEAWTELQLNTNVEGMVHCLTYCLGLKSAFGLEFEMKPVDSLHITVNYLGNIDQFQYDAISNLYRSRYWDGVVELNGLDYFEDADDPARAIVIVKVNSQSLVDHHNEMHKMYQLTNLLGSGHKIYEYNPHVMLGHILAENVDVLNSMAELKLVTLQGLSVRLRKK